MRAALTVITSERPSFLAKRVDVNAEGQIKKSGGGQLVQGIAETMSLDVTRLAEFIANLTAKNALCFGVCGHENPLCQYN